MEAAHRDELCVLKAEKMSVRGTMAGVEGGVGSSASDWNTDDGQVIPPPSCGTCSGLDPDCGPRPCVSFCSGGGSNSRAKICDE